MSDKTIVALGSSYDVEYAFVLPITALFWRDGIGFDPRVFLVGTEAEWAVERRPLVVEALRHHDVPFEFVDHVPGHNYPHVAQNVRQHAACDPAITDDAWIMPGDADLWPLRRSFYQQHDRQRVVCYYANGDHFMGKLDALAKHDAGASFQSLPTCHVAMRARDWRAIYGLVLGDLHGSISRTMNSSLAPIRQAHPEQHGWIEWMSDQWHMTERVCRQEWFPEFRLDDKNVDGRFDVGEVTFINRRGHPPLDRLCRSVPERWATRYDVGQWTDAHVHKNVDKPGTWEVTFPLIESYLPEHAAWADQYRQGFIG